MPEKTLKQIFQEAFMDFFSDEEVRFFLKSIELGKGGKPVVKAFFIQRLLATRSFETILEKIIELSSPGKLRDVIQLNLNDETGFDGTGVLHIELSHATWRKDFYTAMGISEEEIEEATLSGGTRLYLSAMDALLKKEDVLILSGAVLFFEGMIPHEFTYLQKARNLLFSKEFLDASGDMESESRSKEKARRYLDDHIIHDAQSHFPDLLDALQEFVDFDASKIEPIKVGIELGKEARKAFYRGQ